MKINETDRKKQLLNLINKDEFLIPLIDEMLYLEKQLDYLRTLPKIVVHPKDPTKQKATVAAKQYKELLQQYVNIVRTLARATGTDERDEESPLRQWLALRTIPAASPAPKNYCGCIIPYTPAKATSQGFKRKRALTVATDWARCGKRGSPDRSRESVHYRNDNKPQTQARC